MIINLIYHVYDIFRIFCILQRKNLVQCNLCLWIHSLIVCVLQNMPYIQKPNPVNQVCSSFV